jgi:hypothetical protein
MPSIGKLLKAEIIDDEALMGIMGECGEEIPS